MSEVRRSATDKRALTRLSAGVESVAGRHTCGECAFFTFCPQNLGRDPADFVQELDVACTVFVQKLPEQLSTIHLRAQRSMPEPNSVNLGLPVMKASGKIEGEKSG